MNSIHFRYSLLIIVCVFVLREAQAQERQVVRIPNVKGLPLDVAKEKLGKLGLLPDVIEPWWHSEYEPGTVFYQDPKPGKQVRVKDVTIRLRVAARVLLARSLEVTGQPEAAGLSVYVPNVIGVTLDEANAILGEANLQLGQLADEETIDYESGTVLGQVPGAGVQIAAGTPVDLVVATMKMVAVPNVVGRPLGVAREILAESQLQLGELEQEEATEHEPGILLAQKPDAGSRVQVGSPVGLVVATVKRVTVPNVVGLPLEKAREILGRAQLRLGLTEEEKTTEQKTGTVLSQNIAGGMQVPVGSAVSLVVGVKKLNLANWIIVIVGTLVALVAGFVFLRGKRKHDKASTPAIQIHPEKHNGVQQIEGGVAPSSDFDVRLRVVSDSGKQNLEVQGALIIDGGSNHE